MSILSGILIAISAYIYLNIPNAILGAFCFSIGLITIVTFQADLFTGKVGFLYEGGISAWRLSEIWFGNFMGTFLGVKLLPWGGVAAERAMQIVQNRAEAGSLVNLALGIGCGLMMYIAVTGFQMSKNYLFLIAPVAIFILAGFAHCIADMAYIWVADTGFKNLIPVTIGNTIGANLIPIFTNKKRAL